jgi:putative transcriptional regulator
VTHYRVRLTHEAVEDLKRLQALLMDKDPTAAARALDAIETAFELLEHSPFSCRKAWPGDRPLLRELLIPFGNAGCGKRGDIGRVINIPDVAAIRAKTGLSRARFAALLGVSVRTRQDWEQGRRAPSGAARTLLLVADRSPHVLPDVAWLSDARARVSRLSRN